MGIHTNLHHSRILSRVSCNFVLEYLLVFGLKYLRSVLRRVKLTVMSPCFLQDVAESQPSANKDFHKAVHQDPLPGHSKVFPTFKLHKKKGFHVKFAQAAPEIIGSSGDLHNVHRKPKPVQKKGLRVTFEEVAPMTIGKGGANAKLPAKDVTMGYREFAPERSPRIRRNYRCCRIWCCVRFARSPPEIIGEGGDAAKLPARDVEMRYLHSRSASSVHSSPESFKFLDLPPEIRDLIYHIALPYPISTTELPAWHSEEDGFKRAFSEESALRKRSYVNLTLANRQVRQEATYALFHNGIFVIPAHIHTLNSKSWPVLTPAFLKLATSNQYFAHQVRNIRIEIHSIEASGTFMWETVTTPQTMSNMSWICHYLPMFAGLKSIVVVWKDFVLLRPEIFQVSFRPAIGTESRLAALRPLHEYQKLDPGVSVLVSVLVYGLAFTNVSTALKLKSEATAGQTSKRRVLMGLNAFVKGLESEMRQCNVPRDD